MARPTSDCGLKAANLPVLKGLATFDAVASSIPLATINYVASLEWMGAKENLMLVDVGKTMLAQCLSTAAVRAGFGVIFSRADTLLKEFAQARVDHIEKTFRRFLAPDLLIVDDFGLRRLTAQQSQDLYELIIQRDRSSSFAFTSNRGVSRCAWLVGSDICRI
jgi:DNA replication protein DnaC